MAENAGGSPEPAAAGAEGALRRFVLEDHPVRAFWTRLDGPWRELRSLRRHSPAVDALLGQSVTAAVLLAATLKFRGTLSVQLQGRGLVSLLVAQCTHDFRIRAVARVDAANRAAAIDAPSFAQLVGDGRLTVTIEAEERAARYQGIVALAGNSLAECLEAYFATSEQLPTRIALTADAQHAAGVLLQQLPAARDQDEAQAAQSRQVWQQLQENLGSLPSVRLQAATPEHLLQGLCGPYDGRLFAPTPVRFVCRCDRGRVAGLLRALGPEEIATIVAEQGAVTVTCEFCGRPYQFDAAAARHLFDDDTAFRPPVTLN